MSLNSPAFLVAKFGGTSVADPGHWPRILDRIGQAVREGRRPILVCSALSGISNLLEDVLAAIENDASPDAALADFRRRHCEFAACLGLDVEASVKPGLTELERRIARIEPGGTVDPADRASVLALGEIVSSRLATVWLQAQGADAVWIDARDLLEARGPNEDAGRSRRYLAATCHHSFDPSLAGRLPEADALVTQGFLARNDRGETVLLGRGGSDTAAACLAAKVGAERLEIWSDVPGMFTTNPRFSDRARLLLRLTYDEAETLAGMGAKVLHSRCIHPVREARIPLVMRWIQDPGAPGTRIDGAGVPSAGIRGVAMRRDLCLVSMQRSNGWQPVGFMAEVADCFRRHGVSMDLVSSSASRIRTTVDLSPQLGFGQQLAGLMTELDRLFRTEPVRNMGSVTVVGSGLRACMHELGSLLGTARDYQPHMITHGANDMSVSMVVPERAARSLLLDVHDYVLEHIERRIPLGPTWAEFSVPAETPLPAVLAGTGEQP